MSEAVDGSCSCGSLQMDIRPPFPELHICHCSQCRKSNGSAFNLALIVPDDQVNWHDRSSLAEFESSPGKFRAFCRHCGSPAYSRRHDLAGILRMRAGLFPALPRPQKLTQGFRESAWSWAGDLFGVANGKGR